tara:strand:+ start:218 stop:565 length:348 start_codon:yes stop_codon:yes gene_type:complete
MAIQHSTTISKLEVLNSGSEDTVCRVHVTVLSYDDSNMNGTAIDSPTTFKLETGDRSSSSDGWVDFSSLTESTIRNWLGSELTEFETKTQENHTKWITSVLNPPANPTVDKSVPW